MGGKKNKKKSSSGGGGGEGGEKGGVGHQKEKKLNPFEIQVNRVKHNVLGRQCKSERGLPGVARSRANKLRDQTLLEEYKTRNKSNVFLDKRIGENDSTMDLDTKISLRLAAEKKRQFGRKSLFNLNDDEELTHGGFALNDSNLNDKLGLSDDDEDDTGMLDSQFVRDQHFGGGFLTRRNNREDKDDDKPKTKKEWIDEMIMESKRKKDESRKEKEQQHEAVNKLDANLQTFLTLLTSQKMRDEDKEKAKKECDFREYDMLVKELGFERAGKAKAVDKLKKPEDIVKEEREKLIALESDRVRRMKGEEETSTKMRSADDLDDGFSFVKAKSLPISYKNGRMLTEDADDDEADEEDLDEEREEEDEDADDDDKDGDEGGDDEGDDEEDADDDDEESDRYSDVLEESGSEESEDEGGEEQEEKAGTEQKVKDQAAGKEKDKNKKKMMEAARKEIPYTFEVAQDYEAFWSLLENRSPSEVAIILERMISCNHPSLGGRNKEKCEDLCAYLLQTLNVLTVNKGDSPMEGVSPFLYVDTVVQNLYSIAQVTASNTAKALLQVLKEKYEDCSAQNFKRYPMADTFIFLKIAGMLFPASDAFHPVMAPVTAFLACILGEARIATCRDVTAAMFTAHLIFEYLSLSKRFVPELMNLLNGLVLMAIPTQNKAQLLRTSAFKPVKSAASLLVPDEPVKKFKPQKLTLSSINVTNNKISDDFKVNILVKTLELLKRVCELWSGHAAIRAVMRPTSTLLDHLMKGNQLDCVRKAVEELRTAIKTLPTQCKALVKDEAKPKSIRMFEADFDPVIEGMKKRYGTKEHLEQQKLLHKIKRERKSVKREIERDTAYLARQKLKEQLESDAERKRKVTMIIEGLKGQESDYKKMKLKK